MYHIIRARPCFRDCSLMSVSALMSGSTLLLVARPPKIKITFFQSYQMYHMYVIGFCLPVASLR